MNTPKPQANTTSLQEHSFESTLSESSDLTLESHPIHLLGIHIPSEKVMCSTLF